MSDGSARTASNKSFRHPNRELDLGGKIARISHIDLKPLKTKDGQRYDKTHPRVAIPNIIQ
jgi:hypothetical protein